ncbi:trichohyalin-like isoform X1 [Rhopilema esculentum]|uniref:trichohyalin-like isoform X1 n=1 Tax=Rhopilema esculentum TaxID=499914 RepID=UPI0031D16E87
MSEHAKLEAKGDQKETKEKTRNATEESATEVIPKTETDDKEAEESDVIVENETEDGYRSDRSASDDGSTDAVTERKREKGSSGYEESGEEEEGISEISEGRREKREEEEDEYDKEATGDASSGDDISEGVKEDGSEGYEEDTEDEEESRKEDGAEGDDEEEQLEDEVEDVKSASFVPRRTGFWGHDDRHDTKPIEESKYPRRGKNRQLWDKTSERWEHDMFKEEMQGPKESWEIEESLKELEHRQSNRNRRQFGDFVGNRRRGGSRGRRQQRAEREVGDDDSPDFREERDNERREVQPRGRGRAPRLRGRPRGRASFKGERRHGRMDEGYGQGERIMDTRQEEVEDKQEEEKTVSKSVDDADGRMPAVEENQQDLKHQQNDDDKAKQLEQPKEHNRQRKTPPRRTQVGQKDKANDSQDPKGRAKGVTSQKVSTAKKMATEFNVEKKPTPDDEEEEDQKQEVHADESKKNHPAAKPKRYSSQRQRGNASEDAQYQNQVESTIQEGEYFNQMSPQDLQRLQFQQNSMAMLQYQMQQMQAQLQSMQTQGYDGAQGAQSQQQQGHIPPNQGNLMMTPVMQQYLLQMQALQQMQQQQHQQQHQQEQQQQQQQQQQMQQQQQQMQQQQQIQQQQQQRLQEVNMNQSMSTEKQQASPDRGGIVVQGNAYTAVPNNIGQFGVVPHPPPGIYSQAGTRYENPYEQMMSTGPPPQQQPGLFIPQMHQMPTQLMQMQDPQRKMRSAAIPIKPPPEQQES